MGGVYPPQKPFNLKLSVQEINAEPIIKEVPCSKQSAELQLIKDRLNKEAQTSLTLRDKLGLSENKVSELKQNYVRAQSLLNMAERRLSEKKKEIVKEIQTEIQTVEVPVYNKRKIIIYVLAALAGGLGIGVLL